MTTTRPDWASMRPEDFDATLAPTIVDAPTAPLRSTGDDLLSLLGIPTGSPSPARGARPAATAPAPTPATLF